MIDTHVIENNITENSVIENSKPENITHCGTIAIIGKPNVGKSTLLNELLGQKVSITSNKPQTTRHQILGILTEDHYQMIFVDTPGLHRHQRSMLNRIMNRAATNALTGVDLVLFMVAPGTWNEDDDWILEKANKAECPILLVINKIDSYQDKKALLPIIDAYRTKGNFAAIIPISALRSDNLAGLKKQIEELLPIGSAKFNEDQVTDRSIKFLATEIVREKIMRLTEEEVPYSVTLEVEEYEEIEKLVRIGMLILVDKKNHKGILIGKQGAQLKEIGTQARIDLEVLLGKKVFLQLWVKVREGWADDERALKTFGYNE